MKKLGSIVIAIIALLAIFVITQQVPTVGVLSPPAVLAMDEVFAFAETSPAFEAGHPFVGKILVAISINGLLDEICRQYMQLQTIEGWKGSNLVVQGLRQVNIGYKFDLCQVGRTNNNRKKLITEES